MAAHTGRNAHTEEVSNNIDEAVGSNAVRTESWKETTQNNEEDEEKEVSKNKRSHLSQSAVQECKGAPHGAVRGAVAEEPRKRPKFQDGDWTVDSWKRCKIMQNPFAVEEAGSPNRSSEGHGEGQLSTKLLAVEAQLKTLPELVSWEEVRKLKSLLADVSDGKRFVLQAGDCAERFLDCNADAITVKLRIILQMSLIISWISHTSLVRIGRIAGQYAKPRTAVFEENVEGQKVLTFRGDCVNDIDPKQRHPNPERLTQAYFHSAATLNFIRSSVSGGLADLRHSRHWQLDYVMCKKRRLEYKDIVNQLLRTLGLMEACDCPTSEAVRTVDVFTSHEALILQYESALTRRLPAGQWYNSSAHMLWVGDRTRQMDYAHVEFCRGIQNPIGIKVGPSSEPQEIVNICKRINPSNEAGKILLITRFGADKVEAKLRLIIAAVTQAELKVVWQCDPMHGNTKTIERPCAIKTRSFEDILTEFRLTAKIHSELGTYLGGVHFELTGEDVTECLGGPQELQAYHLPVRYTTYCDPRLNYAQSMDMAFELGKIIRDQRRADISVTPEVSPSSFE